MFSRKLMYTRRLLLARLFVRTFVVFFSLFLSFFFFSSLALLPTFDIPSLSLSLSVFLSFSLRFTHSVVVAFFPLSIHLHFQTIRVLWPRRDALFYLQFRWCNSVFYFYWTRHVRHTHTERFSRFHFFFLKKQINPIIIINWTNQFSSNREWHLTFVKYPWLCL